MLKNFIDYYFLLGIDFNATKEEIKSAYRSKVKIYHPDAGGSEVAFTLIKEAYDTLYDEHKRERYDFLYKIQSNANNPEPENNKQTNYEQRNESENIREQKYEQRT